MLLPCIIVIIIIMVVINTIIIIVITIIIIIIVVVAIWVPLWIPMSRPSFHLTSKSSFHVAARFRTPGAEVFSWYFNQPSWAWFIFMDGGGCSDGVEWDRNEPSASARRQDMCTPPATFGPPSLPGSSALSRCSSSTRSDRQFFLRSFTRRWPSWNSLCLGSRISVGSGAREMSPNLFKSPFEMP